MDSLRYRAEWSKVFYSEEDLNAEQQKKLNRAMKKWAKKEEDEIILAWAWDFNWRGVFNGSSGFVVTDRAIYGYVNGERYHLPYKGLFQVVEEKGNIFLHYMDGSKINAYRVPTLYCKELMEFLKAAASENFDYSMEQSRERMKKYRTCGDHDFCEHIYRFQDSEFVVLGVHHSEDNWNDLTYLIREIHEGRLGWFYLNGVLSSSHSFSYAPHSISFCSASHFPWMELRSSDAWSKTYGYREERSTDFLFELVGDVVCAAYPGGKECVFEGKRYPFADEKGTKVQLGKLVPGDNVYVYIDGQGTAYIVYSVHTTVPIRNRNYPINHSSYGSVDAFYDKAFKGYDINKYKLLGDKEDDHRSYLI